MYYEDACQWYNVDTIEAEQEEEMVEHYGNIVSLQYFPQRTHPFWNMKQSESENGIANKVDVILHGMETIGSAERSCDVDMMRDTFHSIVDGEYSELLYKLFDKERVEAELEEFLSYDFIPRTGGGIGMTRLIRAFDVING